VTHADGIFIVGFDLFQNGGRGGSQGEVKKSANFYTVHALKDMGNESNAPAANQLK
jgi:hypothetical protein